MPEQDKKPEDRYSQGDALVIPLESIIWEKEDKPAKTDKPRNGISDDKLKQVLSDKTRMMNDAEGILEMNPDIRVAKEFAVSQTLSPKDLHKTDLRLMIDRTVYSDAVDPEILEAITGHLRTTYDLESKLSEMCGKALFDHGAYINLFVPPDNIDELIQDGKTAFTMESVDQALMARSTKADIIGNEEHRSKLKKAGVSAFTADMGLLRGPMLRRRSVNKNISDIAMESYGHMPGGATRGWKKEDQVGFMRRRETMSYKHNPLVYRVPVDACLPIVEPSDNTVHVGYIILVDKTGRIVSKSENVDYSSALERKLKAAVSKVTGGDGTSNSGNDAFQIIKDNYGTPDENTKYDPGEVLKVYTDYILEPLKDTLEEAGIVDEGYELPETDKIYRIMFERALAGKETKMLFVPADFVSYIAFDYDSMGFGVGLLEKTKFYSSLRTILQLADMMSAIHNSVPGTELDVTLDDTDNDQYGTLQTLMHELSTLASLNFPIGSNNPSDIITAIQKSAIRLNIEGGDAFPNTKIVRNDTQRSRTRTDRDLVEDVTKKLFHGLTVPIEAVERSMEGETATEVILRDVMSAKRSMERQAVFSKGIDNFIRTYIMLSPELYGKIKEKIKDEDKISDFIWAIRLALPSADTAKLEQQLEAMEVKVRLVEIGVENYMTDDLLRGAVGNNDISRDILDDMRNGFKAEFMRQYMRTNNIMPELDMIVNPDNDENLTGPMKQHYEAVFNNFGPVLKVILKQANKIDKIADQLQDDEDSVGFDNRSERSVGVASPFDEEGKSYFGRDMQDDDDPFDDFDAPTPPESPEVDLEEEEEDIDPEPVETEEEEPTPEDEDQE